jgi:hypothetical protein
MYLGPANQQGEGKKLAEREIKLYQISGTIPSSKLCKGKKKEGRKDSRKRVHLSDQEQGDWNELHSAIKPFFSHRLIRGKQ